MSRHHVRHKYYISCMCNIETKNNIGKMGCKHFLPEKSTIKHKEYCLVFHYPFIRSSRPLFNFIHYERIVVRYVFKGKTVFFNLASTLFAKVYPLYCYQ